MSRILTIALSALTLTAPALAHSAPEAAKIYAGRPVGDGDPNAISCYPAERTVSRVMPLVCKTNAEWARIQIHIHNQCGGSKFGPCPGARLQP